MCDPVTIGLATMATVQTVGTLQQGRDTQKQYNQEADQLAGQAALTRDNAQAEAQRIRTEGTAVRGAAVAAYGASGVKIGEGTAGDVERRVMQDYKQDEFMAILTGERNARNMDQSAANMREAGRKARRASYINAATSLMSFGAKGMSAAGFRSAGPGFSGTQMPAPVQTINIPR